MPWTQEINFRATVGGRSGDSADAHVEDSLTANYPETTSQGNDVGWEGGAPENTDTNHNDASGVDVRLAGMAFRNVNRDYRIDLPNTGTFRIKVSMGDHLYSDYMKLEMFDTSTSRGVLCDQTAAQHGCVDATNTEYTEANWPGSNSWSSDITFTTTICRFRFISVSSAYWSIMHIRIEEVETDIPHKQYLYNKAVHRASYW